MMKKIYFPKIGWLIVGILVLGAIFLGRPAFAIKEGEVIHESNYYRGWGDTNDYYPEKVTGVYPWGLYNYYYYIIGEFIYNSGTSVNWRIEKRHDTTDSFWPDWVLDETKLDPGPADYSIGLDIAADANGDYVYAVGGELQNVNYAKWVIRKISTGTSSVVWEVRSDVAYSVSGSPHAGSAYGVAVDSTGVYVAGRAGVLTCRVEKRYLDGGGYVWQQTITPGSSIPCEFYDVAVDSTGVYVVGYNGNWFVQKRDLGDGTIIWSKNTIGKERAFAVAVDSTGVYIGGDSDYLNPKWYLEKRDLNSGALIWSKSTWPDSPAGQAGAILDLSLDTTGLYVVGSVFNDSMINPDARLMKINLKNGDIIWNDNDDALYDYNQEVDGVPQGVHVTPQNQGDGGLYIVGQYSKIREGTSEEHDDWHTEKRFVYIDCGLRVNDGAETIKLACEGDLFNQGWGGYCFDANGSPMDGVAGCFLYPPSPLRMKYIKGNIIAVSGIGLVETYDPFASKIRVQTNDGVKAIRRY